jgi:threonine dehydratase
MVRRTPCDFEAGISASSGMQVFLKRDHLQATGSFKERGAASALTALDATARRRGIVAPSAGNHALGLARHGALLGVPVTLVMPHGAVRVKRDRCRRLGAEVLLAGDSFEQCDQHARRLARDSDRILVHPFDDAAVMAGQGTMGLEIVEQVPSVDAVVVPVGGGGLLAGLAVAIKALKTEVQIVAVEPASAPSYTAACEHGGPVDVPVRPTLADGLAVARIGRRNWSNACSLVDAVVTVTEVEIAAAMLRLFEIDRTAIEGAGATALAAVVSGRLPWLAGRNVVVPVCGANVDASTFADALRAGLTTSVGRRTDPEESCEDQSPFGRTTTLIASSA